MSAYIQELLLIHRHTKIVSFNIWARYFMWNFKGTLWNSIQNIVPIHWKMCILLRYENLRTLTFKAQHKHTHTHTHTPPPPPPPGPFHTCEVKTNPLKTEVPEAKIFGYPFIERNCCDWHNARAPRYKKPLVVVMAAYPISLFTGRESESCFTDQPQ